MQPLGVNGSSPSKISPAVPSPAAVDVAKHRFQKGHRRFGVLIDAQVGEREWTEQPAPHRALVVGGVAFFHASGVVPLIAGLFRGPGCADRRT